MGDKTRGLYPEGKFVVLRKDGTDAPNGKHDGCQYFVLDVTHDQHAVPALRAYAESARNDGYELLADDLEKIVGRSIERERFIYWLLRCYQSGHREGWEAGPNMDETMSGLHDLLCNEGYHPAKPEAAQLLADHPTVYRNSQS